MTQPAGTASSTVGDGPAQADSLDQSRSASSRPSGALGLGPVGDLLGGDWPIQAADTIERVIVGVRRKTTGPVIIASRGIVYGIIAATFGLAAFVLTIITIVRVLGIVLPVWAVDLIVGAVLAGLGLLLLRAAHRTPLEPSA